MTNQLPPPTQQNEYRIDSSGHYRLAIADVIDRYKQMPPDQSRAFWAALPRYLSTAAGKYRPLPAARRYHQSRARNRYCLGGNRSSKSHGLVHEAFFWITAFHPYRPITKPMNIWYASETFELIGQALWPKMETLLRDCNMKYEIAWIKKSENIPRMVTVTTRYGPSRVTYKAYEQGRETFQAADVDAVFFDEQCPQDIYIEATSRIGGGRDLEFNAAFTPIKPQAWLEAKIGFGVVPPNTDIFNFPLDDNRISRGGFIKDETIDALIAEWPIEVVPTRRDGKWGSFVGSIFTTFNRDIHVVPLSEEHRFILRGWNQYQHITSIDWGGANPFVHLWGARIPHMDNAWYIYDEYYWATRTRGPRTLRSHYEEIKFRNDARGIMMTRSYADHDPTNAHEFAELGMLTEPADKDVDGGIEYMQTLLKVRDDTRMPRLFVSERCAELIRTIQLYKWGDPTPMSDRNVPVKKDDDPVDCVRYLVYSDRHADPVYTREIVDLGADNKRTF